MKPPLIYIFEHFAYRLPAALHEGLPVVMLVATIFLFLTLTRCHELTALKAAGVSLYRVSAPILGLGLGVAIVAGLFQELALPTLNERGDEVDRVKIRGQAPRHLQSRQRLWVRSADSRFYRVELLNPGTDDMYGMTILEVDKQGWGSTQTLGLWTHGARTGRRRAGSSARERTVRSAPAARCRRCRSSGPHWT